MPLRDGIDSFAGGFNEPDASIEIVRAFYDCSQVLLQAFRNYPEKIRKPYSYIMVGGEQLVKLEPPYDNPIFMAVCSAGLEQHGIALAKASEWKQLAFRSKLDHDKRKAFVQGHALIDMACYLVYLLNIYGPNKALIQNMVSTHTKTDALGRENATASYAALEKVVRKTVKWDGLLGPEKQAIALFNIAKWDVDKSLTVVGLPRGVGFERECGDLLSDHGFSVQITPATGDFGADLIAFKDEIGFAIQCKDTSKPVGVKAVQEAVGARSHYKVDFAVVCASAGFTDAAVELASSNKVLLCNADQLVKRLDSI